MPKHPAAMEQGHFYKAERPAYNEGQTGKGVAIGGKVTANGGEALPVGGDAYAKKLKKDWSSAESAKGKFPPV